MNSKVVWKDGLSFEATLDGFKFMIDAKEDVGGKNRGPSPKGLILISLAGCTGMDVISILKKMRVDIDSFEVKTESVLSKEHPKKYLAILIKYVFEGKNLSLEKIKKAILLSEEKYCGVSATLKLSVKIANEIIINGKKIEDK